jgi:DNA polymerase-1
VDGAWCDSIGRVQRWAELALAVALRQQADLQSSLQSPNVGATARSESAAELLCAEMSVDGLPMDRRAAEDLVAGIVGARPANESDAAAQRLARDAEVLRHVSAAGVDLRSPGQVKALLLQVGIDVPDTRAARLTPFRDTHPLVPALLAWRKAERVATTYGYNWLDEHLGDDGRLRGAWSGSDGAAGRMTASAGLHNMPAELRPAVLAEPGHVFIRADLGQIEPRVLAAVSGDAALAQASLEADMYAPVAAQLGVDRPTAKVAVLGAMYGQTTGHGATALRRLKSTYPVAMTYLEAADRAAQAGRDLRTYGGRLIRMGSLETTAGLADGGARAAARGRYGRNAMVQGAAAELFKVWAATVRARGTPLGARIVLCLHDELLVHAPIEVADETALLVEWCLAEAVGRWAPDDSVRFVADISVIRRWSDAKG